MEDEENITDTTEDVSASDPDGAGPSELDALRRERDENYDRLLRKTAEFDNYRKRVERERREQADRAVTGILEDLLAVVDDFERALAVEPGEGAAAYRKGVELIYSKLQELLRRQGVKPIEALGADFDPNLHQAVMHEPADGYRDGEVIDELRKGYMLNDRLLRPSMVKVAKA
jgi:molecular chaperone GrpE